MLILTGTVEEYTANLYLIVLIYFSLMRGINVILILLAKNYNLRNTCMFLFSIGYSSN